jgi:hypothetical protein
MLLINNTLNGASACFLGVYFSSGVVGLKSDTGTAEIAVPAGGTVTAQNSQCIVSGAGISFTSSGNTIVLQLPITFKTAFSGAKNVYVTVADRGGLAADWQLKGTWTVN